MTWILALILSWTGLGCLGWGHRTPTLSPVRDGISTYAARGSRGGWIKAGLGMWAASLGLMGWAIFPDLPLRPAFFLAAGTALGVVGFVWIVLFDETVGTFHRLFSASPQAVFEQTYHNAGVHLNALGVAVFLLAWAWGRGVPEYGLGGLVLSQVLRHTPWPQWVLGYDLEASRGLRQRAEVGVLFLMLQGVLLKEILLPG